MLAYLTNLVMFSTDPAAVAALGDAAAQQLLDGMSPSVAALLRAVAPDCRRMVLVCRSVARTVIVIYYMDCNNSPHRYYIQYSGMDGIY